MRPETIAIHGGYEMDPTTRAVAVPIYQTVAYSIDNATMPQRCSTLRRKVTAIRESVIRPLRRRSDGSPRLKAAWMPVRYQRPGCRELRDPNCGRVRNNIISPPQLYGTTYTLFAHRLPSQGITSVREVTSP